MKVLRSFVVLLAAIPLRAVAQAVPLPAQLPYHNRWAGDQPDSPGPLATDLSPAIRRKDIAKAMRKVGDWELVESAPYFSQDWTQAVLYRGYMAAARSLPEPRYSDKMLELAKSFHFEPGPRQTEADDQAIGYTYLQLYQSYHDPAMLAPIQQELDKVIRMPNVCVESCPRGSDEHTPVWWWADSFFMGAPVWSHLYKVTGDRKYLDHMDASWWVTSQLLYDNQEHLFTRDASFLNRHEANGKKVFWSRGNGWVLAALALVLEDMPEDYPTRGRYVAQFQQMAASLLAIQGADGLWRPGLLDPAAYPRPENSGSAFFVYGFAWGIHHHLLDRAKYMPAVEKGWAGLLAHVYADGRLGCIQPIGYAPDAYQDSSSYVFGVGAFLLAGSELEQLAKN